MSRIRISAEEGLFIRVSRRFARRKVKQLTGEDAERSLGPFDAYARAPRLLLAVGVLEDATARLHRMPERLKLLAELKAATLTHCEWCIDIGSHIAHRGGVSDEQMIALPHYRDSDLFDEDEKLVIDYAVAMSSTPVSVSDALFARLRSRFDDVQLVELTHAIAIENMRGRFNLALGIGSAGFRAGMVCALPDTVPSAGGTVVPSARDAAPAAADTVPAPGVPTAIA